MRERIFLFFIFFFKVGKARMKKIVWSNLSKDEKALV